MMHRVKTYKVKNIFGPTIQGEGSRAGMPCVFIRLTGCNKWNGRAKDKAKSTCYFCDTDFVGGDKLTAEQVAEQVAATFNLSNYAAKSRRWIIVSGGEPMLQADVELFRRLKYDWKTSIAVETNGTVPIGRELRSLIDHLTVSPKDPLSKLALNEADDLKVLFPYINETKPSEWLKHFNAKHYYIQPINYIDSLNTSAIAKGVDEVMKIGSPWRLSVQQHKIIGVE